MWPVLETFFQVVVPKTYSKYTSRKVLTTGWVDGEKLSQSTASDVGDLVNVGVICYLKQVQCLNSWTIFILTYLFNFWVTYPEKKHYDLVSLILLFYTALSFFSRLIHVVFFYRYPSWQLKFVLHLIFCPFGMQLLDTGFFHADPHPGNLIRTPDGKLAILDFGKKVHLASSFPYIL